MFEKPISKHSGKAMVIKHFLVSDQSEYEIYQTCWLSADFIFLLCVLSLLVLTKWFIVVEGVVDACLISS
jgi:hypothetical protein